MKFRKIFQVEKTILFRIIEYNQYLIFQSSVNQLPKVSISYRKKACLFLSGKEKHKTRCLLSLFIFDNKKTKLYYIVLTIYMMIKKHGCSHSIICWTSSTLWCYPINILRRIFDITCLAMNTILCINLKLTITGFIFHKFINTL